MKKKGPTDTHTDRQDRLGPCSAADNTPIAQRGFGGGGDAD
jgi:hypothetical protein